MYCNPHSNQHARAAGLFASRAAVGLGEGVAPSSASDMVARVIPNEERSRAMSFIFGGLHVGSLLGLLVAPALIERFGWQTVFYAFGGLGERGGAGQTSWIAAAACGCLYEALEWLSSLS